ncbi:polycystic kidney disease protein 1-like 2 [Asterias rubens]|uniref:polycystic kidney disease protein 1-like 2 n=1 Tax=Asterias rubens TaxID=7604 RepID=UPI001455D544|nr:polycystic kidney disease protein 1-like 2 [Asterias rubens]
MWSDVLVHPGDFVFFVGQTLVFNASLSGNGTADQFLWRFGGSDQTTTSTPTTTWSFAMAGEFAVSVVAANQISYSNNVTWSFVIVDPDNLPCNPSLARIAGRRTNDSSPVSVPRHVPVSFQTNTHIECNISISVHNEWTVLSSDSGGTETAVQLPPTIASDSSVIDLPKGVLEPGLYVLQIDVTVEAGGHGYVVGRECDRLWVRMQPSTLKVSIVGGSARSVGYSSSILLDGSGSYNPDNPSDPTGGLRYAWYCSKVDDINQDNQEQGAQYLADSCFDIGYRLPYSEPSIEMLANSLVPGDIYEFTLTVSLQGRDDVSKSQRITVVAQDPPILSIRCLHNCENKLSIGERAVLAVSSSTPSVSYHWDIISRDHVPDEGFDWERKTTTGRFSSYLAIIGGTFEDGDYSDRTIRATGSHPDSPPGFADFTFELNAPPIIGTCEFTPNEGFALQTHFVVDCEGFWDDEGYLKYTVRIPGAAEKTEASLHFLDPVLYSGADSTAPPVYLPLGDHNNGYILGMVVDVADIHGATVQFKMNVTVHPPESLSSGSDIDTNRNLLNLTSGSDSELLDVIAKGDFQTAVQIIGAVGSILDSEDVTGDDTESRQNKALREEIRSSTVNTIADMPVNSVISLQQTSYALVAITQDETEVTQEIQLTAATKLGKMGAFLKKQSVERTECESCQSSIDAAALNLVSGLANIIDAAVSSVDELQTTKKVPVTNETKLDDEGADDVNATKAMKREVLEKSKVVAKATLAAIEDVQDALIFSKVPGEQPTVIQSPALTLTSQRQERDSLSKVAIGMTEDQNIGFILPETTGIDSCLPANYTDAIDTQMVQFATDPFVWTEGKEVVTSEVVGLQLKTVDRQEIKVRNLPQAIQIFVPKRTVARINYTEINMNRSATFAIAFGFTTTNNATVSVVVLPSDPDTQLTCCLRFQGNSSEAAGNITRADCYMNATLPLGESGYRLPTGDEERALRQSYTWMIDGTHLQENGIYQVLCSVDESTATSDDEEPSPDETITITTGVYSSQCLFWDDDEEMWGTMGCKVGPLSSPDVTHCLCIHLTYFSSSFLVMPNKVNFLEDSKLFLTFLENPVVVTTVGCILVAYVLVAVWARKRDKADELKAGVITLADNDPFAHYRYDVTIVTGMRRGAGTTAVATLTLVGSDGKSRPQLLAAPGRQVMQRGSADSFIITTRESIGEVTEVRIWHDNAGDSPEWYASRITVHDLELDESWFVMCNSWLAVDIGEGLIDRTFPTASAEDLKDFKHLFSTRATKDFQDGHLWFSIFNRPPKSHFSCLQRVSCCLSLLMCVMLTSIMFYGVPNDPTEQVMDLGTFRITFTEILIGIESSILAFPINMLIVAIFRYSRPARRTSKPSEVKRAVDTNHKPSTESRDAPPVHQDDVHLSYSNIDEFSPCTPYSSITSDTISNKSRSPSQTHSSNQHLLPNSSLNTHDRLTTNMFLFSYLDEVVDALDVLPPEKFPSAEQYERARRELRSIVLTTMTVPTPSSSAVTGSGDSKLESQKGRCSCTFLPNGLPHGFIYIGWFLVISTTLVSSYFTMLYGLKYGKKRSIDWLMSLGISLFQSIFITQPMKVLLLAAFVSMVMREWDADEDGSDDMEDVEIENAQEVYHQLLRKWKGARYRPPTATSMESCRKRKALERKMYALLREIFGYIMFMWLVIVIAYNQTDRHAYLLTQNIKDVFFSSDEFESVTNYNGFYEWADVDLVPGLYQGDTTPIPMSFLIGGVRLRQLRVREDVCQVNPSFFGIIDGCLPSYTSDSEDTNSYNGSWRLHNAIRNYSANSAVNKLDPWAYQEKIFSTIWGHITSYGTGGYAASLGLEETETRSFLERLRVGRWLDARTRALSVEWTVYNANTNLFAVIRLLVEIPSSGGFIKTTLIRTVRFYRNVAGYQVFVIFIEMLFSMYVVFYTAVEVMKFRREGRGYWKSAWNWLELFIILTCLWIIVVYIYRHVFTEKLFAIFRTRPGDFVNFQDAASIAETFRYLLGLLLILCTVKFLHLLRLNPRTYLLTAVLSSAAKDALAFAAYIGLVMCAFAVLFQLTFGTHTAAYSTMAFAFESLFILFLGDYDFDELAAVDRYMTPIMVFTFQVVATFLFLNVLLSVLNNSMSYVRRNQEPSEDGTIGLLLLYKILSWFGIKHKTEI